MKSVVILSGGMDSSLALKFTVSKNGAENVAALSFNYGQKQAHELKCAEKVCKLLEVPHKIVHLRFLQEFSKGFSANVDEDIEVPSIKDILGHPQPVTYVPNRNMVMLSIAASFAETVGAQEVVCGIQAHDAYGYWDATKEFVDAMNNVIKRNRQNQIEIVAPYADLSKTDELLALQKIDGNVNFLKNTFTCYNPQKGKISCGNCPSCAERIQAFINCNLEDPIPYAIDINWIAK